MANAIKFIRVIAFTLKTESLTMHAQGSLDLLFAADIHP